MEKRPDGVKVLCIVGTTRSGSTILDNLLGELHGFFSAGELRYLWERGMVGGRRCGCGRTLADCPVWSEVLEVAFGGSLGTLDPEDVIRWQQEAVRVRHTANLLKTGEGDQRAKALESYVEVASRLYPAIAKVVGCSVVVDSSKRPSDAALLSRVPGVSPYCLHLVRDARAVAYSWRRHKTELDRGHPTEMPRRGSLKSSADWLSINLAAELVARRFGADRYIRIRYEDFVRNPRATIDAVTHMLEEDPGELPISEDRTVHLSGNHTVSGNPSRFLTGEVQLKADSEWLSHQPLGDRWLTTLLSLPMLHRYGYKLIPEPQSLAG